MRKDYLTFAQSWETLLQSDEFGEEEEDEEFKEFEPTDEEAEIGRNLSENYKPIIQSYLQDQRSFFDRLDEASPQIKVPFLVNNLSRLNQTDWLLQVGSFSEQINRLIAATEEEQDEAKELYSSAYRTQLKIVYGNAILSALLGLFIIFWITRSLMRPLKEMTSLTQKSVEERDFNVTVPISSSDELGTLGETFNAYTVFTSQLLREKTESNEILNSTLEELKKKQIQLVQSEKMSSLGQLVAGVAHEINNPVSFIHGNLDHVKDQTDSLFQVVKLYGEVCDRHQLALNNDEKEELEELELNFIKADLPKVLQSMRMGTERIQEIVLSLRNFSRKDEAEQKTVDIHDGLQSTLSILSHRLKATSTQPKITVDRNYGQLPAVSCYPGLLNQVFMNVLSNAIDAVRERAEVLNAVPMVAGGHPIDQESDQDIYHIAITTQQLQGKDGGDYVEIAIADRGQGIQPELQSRIFDPFFTTKPVGQGTGLGMSISYQIITEQHNGSITCESQWGKGTAFRIRIPVQ
ncbi:MAG: ATP-binding protein [Cyanobacteria bacterium P01_D01_bin.73]